MSHVEKFGATVKGARLKNEDKFDVWFDVDKKQGFVILADGHNGSDMAKFLVDSMKKNLKESNLPFRTGDFPTANEQADRLMSAYMQIPRLSDINIASACGSTLTVMSVCWDDSTNGSRKYQVASLGLGDSPGVVIDTTDGSVVDGCLRVHIDMGSTNTEHTNKGGMGEESEPCATRIHTFSDPLERARYTELLSSEGKEIRVKKMKGSLDCENRVVATLQPEGIELPEPSRAVSVSANRYGDTLRFLQRAPEIKVHEFERMSNHPGIIVMAMSDGVDSKKSLIDIGKALVDPLRCEERDPSMFAFGLQEIALTLKSKNKYNGIIPRSVEWSKNGASSSSVEFMKRLLEQVDDRDWIDAIDLAITRTRSIRSEHPNLSLNRDSQMVAEYVVNLPVLHGSDDNVTIAGVMIRSV